MSCQAAIPLGAQAANTVLSRIAGTQPAVINQAFTGQCVSIGRSYGTVQLARPDDPPLNLFVGGRVAASIKEAVCKGTVWGIRREAAKPGWYRWLKGGRGPEQLAHDAVRTPGPPPANHPKGLCFCGRCCSPSPTKSWVRQRNPMMFSRTATCAGRR